eukprot:g65477.t1
MTFMAEHAPIYVGWSDIGCGVFARSWLLEPDFFLGLMSPGSRPIPLEKQDLAANTHYEHFCIHTDKGKRMGLYSILEIGHKLSSPRLPHLEIFLNYIANDSLVLSKPSDAHPDWLNAAAGSRMKIPVWTQRLQDGSKILCIVPQSDYRRFKLQSFSIPSESKESCCPPTPVQRTRRDQETLRLQMNKRLLAGFGNLQSDRPVASTAATSPAAQSKMSELLAGFGNLRSDRHVASTATTSPAAHDQVKMSELLAGFGNLQSDRHVASTATTIPAAHDQAKMSELLAGFGNLQSHEDIEGLYPAEAQN